VEIRRITGFASAVAFLGVFVPAVASAQTGQTGSGAQKVSIGAVGGAAAVQEVGGLAGGELGVRFSNRLTAIGEGLWLQNVVTRRRLDLAAAVASAMQSAQGKTASGSVEAPAFYAGGGVRFDITTHDTWRPFVTFTAGIGRITLKPSFTLGGADVTKNISTYGVTLGEDLTGESTEPAFSTSFGVRMLHGRWYVDGAFGVIAIQTPDQATNVLRASAGFGVRF